MENVLACRTGSYGRFHAIALEHLAEIGVRNVEIGLPPPGERAALKDQLRSHGLSASSVSAKVDLKNPSIGQEYGSIAAAARELGADRIFVSASAGELDMETVYARLRDVGDACAKHDVMLILETHPDLVTNGDVARRTMEAVSHPNVRINWDTANVYFYNEDIDGIEELKKVVDFVGGVHLQGHERRLPGVALPNVGSGNRRLRRRLSNSERGRLPRPIHDGT